jgi:hypothetical protein
LNFVFRLTPQTGNFCEALLLLADSLPHFSKQRINSKEKKKGIICRFHFSQTYKTLSEHSPPQAT